VDIKEGTVVVSTAGHDKDGIFAVIGFTHGEYALIADGKVRKLEKPKKKKLKHLEPIGTLEQENPTQTNRQLKKALKSFNAGQPGEVILLV
jgi:ribosomal protein L14E/L6E/L27E